ncbi:MAG: M50 family metallopeptidase [Candidatus Berkelbacteria bacterium]|nr:M50 family metallopeptidase [Candidatus Berkelbacteria bacterium]
MFWLTLLAFLVILGLLVFVHELGHFLMAKANGVKVEEFAFGFPPKLICKKRGETKYCINLIPFGGYVKMLGEERDEHSSRSFSRKKPRQKFLIIVAGVLMNFILAGFLLGIGYMVGMSPIRLNPEQLGGQQNHQVIVAQIQSDSPAQVADLKSGDIILGFETVDAFRAFTVSKSNQDITLLIKRDGENLEKQIHVSQNSVAPIGVGIVDVPSVKLPFFKAIYFGFKEMLFTTGYVFVILLSFLKGIFFKGQIANEVAGPIGIFNITGEAVKMGIAYLIQLAAILSINLGLVNILPFPALDGGRAVIIAAEGATGKKVIKTEIENFLHMIGFIILILFILFITFREVIALL